MRDVCYECRASTRYLAPNWGAFLCTCHFIMMRALLLILPLQLAADCRCIISAGGLLFVNRLPQRAFHILWRLHWPRELAPPIHSLTHISLLSLVAILQVCNHLPSVMRPMPASQVSLSANQAATLPTSTQCLTGAKNLAPLRYLSVQHLSHRVLRPTGGLQAAPSPRCAVTGPLRRPLPSNPPALC